VLDRSSVVVQFDGCPIRVKLAWWNGAVSNLSVEWEDIAVAAETLGRPAKDVLAEAEMLAVAEIRRSEPLAPS
jgi:uncharacterized protein (DUF111 family)